MEITVNGKRVILRDRLSAREGWPLRALMAKAAREGDLSFEEEAQALSAVIESWDFPGDPHDVESYAELDMPDFLAIDIEVGKQLRVLILPGNEKN
jgi:hypothetical protein